MGKGTLPPIPRGYQSIQPEQRELPPLPKGYEIEGAEKKKSDGVSQAFSGVLSASTSVPQLESGEINSILGRIDKSPASPQYIKQKEKFAKVLKPELEVSAEEFDADPVSVASKVVLSKIPQVKRYDEANANLSAAPKQPLEKQIADKDVIVEAPKAELTSSEGLQAIRDVKNYYSNNTNTSLSHLSKISGIDNADDFYDDRFDEQIKQSIRPGNQTDAIAYQRLQEAKTARKVIANNLEQGRGIADMAVDYAAATNPDMAAVIEQLKSTPTFEEAIGGKQSVNRTAGEAFDNATIGRFLYDMLNSTAIAQEAEKVPGLTGKLNSESNSLIFKYPEFGKMYLGNKISQKMEDMGLNNAILNVSTKEERDKAVEALIAEGKMTPLEERFYKDEIRPLTGLGLLRRKIAGKPVINTTGFIESGAESLYGGARDIPKGLYELTGLRESVLGSQGALREDLEAANRVVGVKPKNLAHEISMNAGQFFGQSLSIGGGGKLLNNLKLAKDPRTVMGMLGGLQAYANYMPQARIKFPGDELKQRGYATILGAIEWKTEGLFNDQKIVDGLLGKMKPGIAETIKDFTSKKISSEAAREQVQGLIKKAIKDTPEAMKYFSKAVLQNDIEEISAELGEQVTSGVFENKPFNEWINGEDLWQTARMSTLGSPIIGGLSARADMQKNRGITAKNIYSMAQDPEYWKGQITEAAKLDKDIAAEAEDKMQNIDRAAQIYQELQSTDLTEKQKVKYLITELEKNVKQKEAEGMAIPALQDKAIQGFAKVQQNILDGNDDGTIEGDVSDELTPDETKAVKIAAKEGLPGIYGEIDPLDGVKGIAYQAQGITEDAEGNITEVEGGGRTEDLLNMGVSQDLIDAAVKAFPNPKIDPIRELDMGTEEITKPIELSTELPEGYVMPEKAEAETEVNLPTQQINETTQESPVSDESIPSKESIGEQEEIDTDSGATSPPEKRQAKVGVYAERPGTELSFRGLQNVANEFGLSDVESREKKNDIQLFADARNTMKEWADSGKYAKNIERLLTAVENRELNLLDEQRVILQQHLANEVQKLRDITDKNSEKWKMQFQVVKRIKEVGNIARSESGAALRIPIGGYSHPVKDFGDAMVAMEEANGGKELTEAQKAEVERYVKNYEDKLKIADEKVAAAEAKYAELQAQKEVGEVSKKYRKSNKDFSSERKQIVENIREKLKKVRSESTVTVLPYAKELFAIAPDVAKLVKSMVEQGVNKLEDLVTEIHSLIKDEIVGIKETDVVDLIAGKYNEVKDTKADLEKKLKQIKDKKSAEAVKIRARIKSGDFAKPEKRVSWVNDSELKIKYPKLYNEALDALDAKEQAQLDFDIAVFKREQANRSKIRKGIDVGRSLIATTKAIKSGIDDSAVMMQNIVAMISHPRSAVKALREHALDAVSEKRFRRYLTELHNSPIWDLIEKSGLDITDPKSLKEQNKEEIFDNNLLNKDIKIRGKKYNIGKYVTRPFERAFTSLGNAMRVNMFTRIAERWLDEGKTFDTHPEDYKSLATLLNTETGRGKLHTQVQRASQLITAGIWSPRLMASRINMLGLSELAPLYGGKGYYAGMTPDIRKMALMDMVKFIGAGVALMMLAGINGAEIDDDPESPTFGTIRIGDKKYNAWGGFAPYVKTIYQGITNHRNIDGRRKEVKRSELLFKFFRSRLTPAAGVATNLLSGSDYSGKPVTVLSELQNLAMPLSVNSVIEAVKKDGAMGILTEGIPSFIGINVSDERDYQKKDKPKATNINF